MTLCDPGFYQDIPFSNYCKLPGINSSALAWGIKSARHIKAYLDGEIKQEGDDLRFGRALHAAILEPDTYKGDWQLAKGCSQKLKSGDRKDQPCGAGTYKQFDGQWRCKKHAPKGQCGVIVENAISPTDALRIEAACKNLLAEPAIKLLRARGGMEETAVCDFDGAEFGGMEGAVRAKIRMDKRILETVKLPPYIIDVKKVQQGKADDESCEWSIYRYGYDVKASFYRKVHVQLTGVDPVFVWVFIEDKPPYAINVIQCDEATRLIGDQRLADCIKLYANGMNTGNWPGHLNIPRPKQGGLPESIKRKYLGSKRR